MGKLSKSCSKAFVVLAAMTLAFCLVGCGNSEPKQEEKPLEVTSGYAQDENVGIMSVGVLINNPNENLQFDNAYLSITVKDADGKVIASDNEFMVGDVLPNEEFAVAITMTPGERKAASIDVQIHSDTPSKADATSGITIDENTMSTKYDYEPSYSTTTLATVNGEYSNETELDYDSILITALFFDSEGNIIGAGMDEQWSAAKGTTPFEIYGDSQGSPDNIASFKTYSHVYTMNHSN